MSSTDFKQTLWKAADKLRAQMDAAEYKHMLLQSETHLASETSEIFCQRENVQKLH